MSANRFKYMLSNFCSGIIVHFGEIYTPAMAMGAAKAGDLKVAQANFREVFLRGIGCNYAVVAAVFLASLAKDVVSKVIIAYLPIFFFVSAGFDHVVANMFLLTEALMTKKASFNVGEYIWKSVIASFLGNVVGAALLVIPLVYVHGRDAFDPNSVNQNMVDDTYRGDGTLSGLQSKSTEWKHDIERPAAAP